MFKTVIVTLAFTLALAACSATPHINSADTASNPYTHGNVQLTLKKGITDQSDVLNTFGPPNVATIDASGNEVWTYQKNATVAKATESNAYGTIIILGGSHSTSGFEQSSRTMTLIIKFDESKKVTDFKSMATSF